jgi:formate hydrogenlyase subunit 3/multisubunit Na+/H+ antiporter MnhD subunit
VPEERRHSLTPLESELRVRPDVEPGKPTLATRFRRRFHRDEPTTMAGVLLRAVSHLAVAVALASGIALIVDHFMHRNTAVGFYIVGAALLAVAFGTSTGLGRAAAWTYGYGPDAPARRLNMGVPYVVAGAFVLAIGVIIEAVSR